MNALVSTDNNTNTSHLLYIVSILFPVICDNFTYRLNCSSSWTRRPTRSWCTGSMRSWLVAATGANWPTRTTRGASSAPRLMLLSSLLSLLPHILFFTVLYCTLMLILVHVVCARVNANRSVLMFGALLRHESDLDRVFKFYRQHIPAVRAAH